MKKTAAALVALLAGATPSAGSPRHGTGLVRTSYYDGGGRTASGAPFKPMGPTCAHRSYPFGTRLHLAFGKRRATCTVTDRGPAVWTGRSLDVSRGIAGRLGLLSAGVGMVRVSL